MERTCDQGGSNGADTGCGGEQELWDIGGGSSGEQAVGDKW